MATINATTGEVDLIAVGSTVITARLAGDSTYAPLSKQYTLTVAKATQAAISNNGANSATFGDSPLSASVSGGSGSGAVSAIHSSNSNVASINSNGQIVIVGAGTSLITLQKAADASHQQLPSRLRHYHPRDY